MLFQLGLAPLVPTIVYIMRYVRKGFRHTLRGFLWTPFPFVDLVGSQVGILLCFLMIAHMNIWSYVLFFAFCALVFIGFVLQNLMGDWVYAGLELHFISVQDRSSLGSWWNCTTVDPLSESLYVY